MASATPPMSCSCHAMLFWLCEHGGRHACSVRQRNRPEQTWTERDWLAHFEEEERLAFMHFPPRIAANLIAEHRMFREQLARTGTVDMNAMREHAAIEDFYAKRLAR